MTPDAASVLGPCGSGAFAGSGQRLFLSSSSLGLFTLARGRLPGERSTSCMKALKRPVQSQAPGLCLWGCSSIRRWSLPSWSIPVEFSSIWRWSLSLLVYTHGILLHQEMVTPLLVYTRGILLHLEMVTLPPGLYPWNSPPSGDGHSPPGLYPWDSPPSGDGHSPPGLYLWGCSSIRRWSLPLLVYTRGAAPPSGDGQSLSRLLSPKTTSLENCVEFFSKN